MKRFFWQSTTGILCTQGHSRASPLDKKCLEESTELKIYSHWLRIFSAGGYLAMSLDVLLDQTSDDHVKSDMYYHFDVLSYR